MQVSKFYLYNALTDCYQSAHGKGEFCNDLASAARYSKRSIAEFDLDYLELRSGLASNGWQIVKRFTDN